MYGCGWNVDSLDSLSRDLVPGEASDGFNSDCSFL